MAIDATVGGASANSYVTMAEAHDYFDQRIPSTAWFETESTPDREAALVTGRIRLDQERFRGVPKLPLSGTLVSQTQALKWPRQGVVDDEGWTYRDDVIPGRIKRAQMELAYAVLSGDLALAQTGLERFSRARVGPLEVDIRHQQRAGTLPEAVRRELRGLTIGGGVSVPLMRS